MWGFPQRRSKTMKALIFAGLLAGCASGMNFHPKTEEGVRCKQECARNMAMCQGSSYSCDRATATCISACEDVDRIKTR